MSKVKAYSAKVKTVSSVNLSALFSAKENKDLLAQALRVYEDRMHLGLSKVKTRGEVKASTRKIYRQKGTGLARHGAISAPIFVGGGIAHGPKGKKRVLTLPKKMRQKALSIALSLKAKEGKIVAVSDIKNLKKTKDAEALLTRIKEKEAKDQKVNKVTVCLSEDNLIAISAFRNLKGVQAMAFRKLNAYQVFYGGLLVIDKDALAKPKKETKTK